MRAAMVICHLGSRVAMRATPTANVRTDDDNEARSRSLCASSDLALYAACARAYRGMVSEVSLFVIIVDGLSFHVLPLYAFYHMPNTILFVRACARVLIFMPIQPERVLASWSAHRTRPLLVSIAFRTTLSGTNDLHIVVNFLTNIGIIEY